MNILLKLMECALHTREKPLEHFESTVMQIILKYVKYKIDKHYFTIQRFSTHKYEQNETLSNFLDQILTILSHSKIGPYLYMVILTILSHSKIGPYIYMVVRID